MKSAARVLDILEFVGRNEKPLALSEISVALGLPKSSTYLLLQTLVHRGYLEGPSNSGPFHLGLKVLELGGAYSRGLDVVREFRTVAQRVVATCQETVQLAVLDGVDIVYLAKEDGTRPVRLVSHVGKRLPGYATALGKVLLAAVPTSDLMSLLSSTRLSPMTPCTIRTLPELMEELSLVRKQGYALDREEALEGLWCFAAPVLDSHGATVAAISVSIPKARILETDASFYVTAIKDAAAELSRRVGFAHVVNHDL